MIDGLFERSCAPIRAPDAAPAATVLHRAPPEVVVKPLPARTLLTLASAALLAATPAQADWPADGLQLDSSSHGILGIDFRPCETGDVLTFVRVGANSPYQRIYRISPTGALGPLVPIDSNDYSGFPDYPVATDGAGGLWHAPSDRDVSLEHADGNNVHTPNVSPYFWSIAATTAIENASRVASDGSGGAFTSWLRNGSQLRLKRTSATGVTVAGWPAAGLIVCDDYYLPDMKSDGHGGVWIVAETVEPQIFHLGPTGASVASWGDGSLVLDPPAGSYSVAPRLIPSDSTHFFACWQENSTDRIVVQPFDADGNMAARAVVTSNPNVLTSSVNYTLDSQGGLWVSWRQDSTDLVRHFLADGTPVSGPAALDLSPFDSHARLLQNPYSGINTPAYAAGPSGGLIAIWNDGRLNRPSLRARWLAADGSSEPSEPDSGRVLTVVDSVTYGYNHWTTVTVLGAMSDGAGGVYAGWEFGDRGAASTYARVGHLVHPPAVAPASYHLVLPFRSGGYVTASPNLTSYVSGTLVTVTAVISYGFTFTGWTGDTTSNENPLTIRMLHDRTLGHAAVPCAESLLCPIGDGEHACGLSLATRPQRRTQRRSMSMVPGGFDKKSSHMAVARLRDGSTAFAVAARVLARHQPDIGHELPRRVEAAEVVKLGHEAHGRHGIDALEASKPCHRLTVRLGSAELLQLQVELALTLRQLVHGEEVAVERRLAHRIVEPQLLEPCHVARTPVVLRLSVDAVPAQQELREPVPGSQKVDPHVIAATAQVA
jgi:hypothetical protein